VAGRTRVVAFRIRPAGRFMVFGVIVGKML